MSKLVKNLELNEELFDSLASIDVTTALGYTPENVANKKITLSDNSDTYYPTQKAVVTEFALKEDKALKETSSLDTSIIKYPCNNVVKTAVDLKANDADVVHDSGNETIAGIKTFSTMPVFPSYERHIQIDAKLDGAVANQPNPVDFFTVGGLQYATTGAKFAFAQWEVPDDWDGGNVIFEIDWFPDSGAISGTAAVRWTVEYRAIAEGEAINNGSSVTLDNGAGGDTADYTQYQTKHTRFTLTFNNANQPLTKQDHVYFKVSRDTAVANDFGGTVTVSAYEIIYNSVSLPTSN